MIDLNARSSARHSEAVSPIQCFLSGKAIVNASNAAPECDRIAIKSQDVEMPDLALVKEHERCHGVVVV